MVRIISVLSNNKTAVTLIYDVTFRTHYRMVTPFVRTKNPYYANFIISFFNAIHVDVARYCLTIVYTRIPRISTFADL